jgi:hypothetical protein
MNNILCMNWGDKYDDSYVEKLKEQCEANCTVPFKFWCFTDKPEKEWHIPIPWPGLTFTKAMSGKWIPIPTTLDEFYDEERGFFWAYRKCHMFNYGQVHDESSFPNNSKFLFLDLDVIVHKDLKYFFDLPNDKPWIVRGWWNDILTVKRNYAKHKSTPLNSSVILWKKGQMIPVWDHVTANAELIFFTYPSLDNYFAHHWYDPWNEDDGFLRGFPQGDIYSWYKGNTFPDDMELKKLRTDHKICLFNNSTQIEGENDDEIKKLWL